MALSLSEADRIRPAKLKITSSYSKREVKEGKFPPEFVAFLEVLVTCFGSNLLIRPRSSERAAAFGAFRPGAASARSGWCWPLTGRSRSNGTRPA